MAAGHRAGAPQQSRQFGVGLARQFKDQYEFSVEGYYKAMTNLIEYREGASFLVGFGESEDWQDKVEIGRGWSYGAELFVQKKRGRTTGWIGYTLSWTKRRFDQLNQGRTFPYRYDRRHDLALVLTHQLTPLTNFSLTWVIPPSLRTTPLMSRLTEVSPVPHPFSKTPCLTVKPMRSNCPATTMHPSGRVFTSTFYT